MNLEGPVGAFCLELWNQREDSALTKQGAIRAARLLVLAMGDEVKGSETYEPVVDLRVMWAWGVLRAVVCGTKPQRASELYEANMAFLLGKLLDEDEERMVPPLCGKDLAAGGDR